MNKKNNFFESFIKKLKKNVSLKDYTTFRIGGNAKYFFEANTKDDVIFSLKFAQETNTPFFIIGCGSNILISDEGFNGLIIKLNLKNYFISNNKLYSEAGVSVSAIVDFTINNCFSGFEWAGGLPGTIGGAIFGNAGAFGGEIKDNILWVEAIDNLLQVKKLCKEECNFGYRNSIFKEKNWIILSAEFSLRKGDKDSLKEIALSHIEYRKNRGPLSYPNAGSIFKNYDLKKASPQIIKKFESSIKIDPFPVIPAAAIISKVPDLVGFRIGDAQVSTKHPNFIINLGNAKAKDVKNLIDFVKKRVKNKFGIILEEEIRYIGF
jgi:UDP-N-acetylmuramate dehydrogenase